MSARTDSLPSLTRAWLVLVALTLASIALGKWSAAIPWLPLLMAVVIWIKCAIIADRFIEADRAHPFVRRVVRVFIALAPIALILVTLFGPGIARLLTLK